MDYRIAWTPIKKKGKKPFVLKPTIDNPCHQTPSVRFAFLVSWHEIIGQDESFIKKRGLSRLLTTGFEERSLVDAKRIKE